MRTVADNGTVTTLTCTVPPTLNPFTSVNPPKQKWNKFFCNQQSPPAQLVSCSSTKERPDSRNSWTEYKYISRRAMRAILISCPMSMIKYGLAVRYLHIMLPMQPKAQREKQTPTKKGRMHGQVVEQVNKERSRKGVPMRTN